MHFQAAAPVLCFHVASEGSEVIHRPVVSQLQQDLTRNIARLEEKGRKRGIGKWTEG